MVTRPREQAGGLAARIEAAGGRALLYPAIEIQALAEPRWRAELAARLTAGQFGDPECARVAGALLGDNNDCSAPVEQILRDPTLTETISRLLVVEEPVVDEREVEQCLEHIERDDLKRKVESLKKEIVTGTLESTDRRFQEYQRLAARLERAGVTR